MHAIAVAVAPGGAGGTATLAGPAAVAIPLKAVVPDLPEVVFVDITLIEVRADTCAAGDRPIYTYSGYADTRHTAEKVVAYLRLIAAQKALASIRAGDFALFASCGNKLHQFTISLWR